MKLVTVKLGVLALTINIYVIRSDTEQFSASFVFLVFTCAIAMSFQLCLGCMACVDVTSHLVSLHSVAMSFQLSFDCIARVEYH